MHVTNRSIFHPRPHGTYRVAVNDKAESTTVYLYDEIGIFGVMAEQFVKDLEGIKTPRIDLRINSPGGMAFEGVTMYNALVRHPAHVVAHVDGLAASIAAVITMGANEVQIAPNAFLMIHEPWSMVVGGADELRHEADVLDKVAGKIVETFVQRTGASQEQVLDWMGDETWFTAEEAIAAKFVDAIDEEPNADGAKNLFDLSVFARTPAVLLESKTPPTERDLERVLRDAGCSRAQAKSIIAQGFAAEQREAAVPETKKALREAAPVPKDAVAALLAKVDIQLATARKETEA